MALRGDGGWRHSQANKTPGGGGHALGGGVESVEGPPRCVCVCVCVGWVGGGEGGWRGVTVP